MLGVGCQSSLGTKGSKVSDEALKPQGDQPMEHQRVMAPVLVVPDPGVQDVQEVLGQRCQDTYEQEDNYNEYTLGI